MDYSLVFEALKPVGASVLRSVGGWGVNAWKDGKVEPFEWKQLGATLISVVSLSLIASIGLDGDMTLSSAVGYFGDVVLCKVDKFIDAHSQRDKVEQ